MAAVGVRSLDMSEAVMVMVILRMSMQARVPVGMPVRMKVMIGSAVAGEVARCLVSAFDIPCADVSVADFVMGRLFRNAFKFVYWKYIPAYIR